MRAFIYDTLVASTELQTLFNFTAEQMQDQVMPRRTRDNINLPKPFIIFGLGNQTNEDLAEDSDHIANRQFFQVWIHDEGGDYGLIDEAVEAVKRALVNASSPSDNVTTIVWLETSAEFNNETYNTLFRYIRFQAILSKGEAA